MAPPHALDVLRSALLKIRSRVLDGHEFRPATAASLGHIVDDAIEEADALGVDGDDAPLHASDRVTRKLRQLVNRCPIGYSTGRLMTLRSFRDGDMIGWLGELRVLVGVSPVDVVLPPPLLSMADAMREAVPMHPDGDPAHNHDDLGYHPNACPRCKLSADNARESDALEAAYWTFDARRAGRYKRDAHGVLGPQEERDAFKAAVREHVIAEPPPAPSGHRDPGKLAVEVMITTACVDAERVMQLSNFNTAERRMAKALLMVTRPALRGEVEEHELQRATGARLADQEAHFLRRDLDHADQVQAATPSGFVRAAVGQAIGYNGPQRYRDANSRPLASPKGEAAARAEHGDGDGSIPGGDRFAAHEAAVDRVWRVGPGDRLDANATREKGDPVHLREPWSWVPDEVSALRRLMDDARDRIAQLEAKAAGPSLKEIADTMIYGARRVPPVVQEQVISFPGVSRVPKREHPLHGRERCSGLSSRMPKMDDSPLEWDEERALDRHAPLRSLNSIAAIRSALWNAGEWVKPATPKAEPKAEEPAQDHPWPPSELTFGELESIRKTCQTYSSDSCWRSLLAAFDAVCASERAAKAEAKIANALLDRAKRANTEYANLSHVARGVASGDALTVNPDSDFAKIARGEATQPGLSFEVNMVPTVPDRVEVMFNPHGPGATVIRHVPGCDSPGCLGCGVVTTASTLPAPDADGMHRVQLTAEQTAKPGRFEASADKLSLEDWRSAVEAASEDGVVSAHAIAEFLVECYGPNTKSVVTALRAELQAHSRPVDVGDTLAIIDSVLVELDKAIALAITDVSAAVARIEARPEDDIPF